MVKGLENDLISLRADKSAVDEIVLKLSAEVEQTSAELEEMRAVLSSEKGLRESVQSEVCT